MESATGLLECLQQGVDQLDPAHASDLHHALQDVRQCLAREADEAQRLNRAQANAIVQSAGIISELEETQEALRIAKARAEDAHQAKSEFLANMSHELRTPLHSILSFARFGVDESLDGDREDLHEYFQMIQQSCDGLLSLVNNLLDLSKLDAGKMLFDFERCAVAPLVLSVMDEFVSLCSERTIDVDAEQIDERAQAAVGCGQNQAGGSQSSRQCGSSSRRREAGLTSVSWSGRGT